MSQSRPVSVSSTAEEMQAERNSLEDFASDRARDFVGRQSVITRVWPTSVSPCQAFPHDRRRAMGHLRDRRSGFGQERAVRRTSPPHEGHRRFHSRARRRTPAPRASSVDAMLRRWIEELGSALGVGDVSLAENTDPEIVEMAFGSLLGRMSSQRRVVILIDALDQFKKTARGKFMTWLPPLWPTNARLVATAIAGGASKVLAERPGVEALPLPPLDAHRGARHHRRRRQSQ